MARPLLRCNLVAAELSFPPRLGEHNDVIYGEVLGYSRNQLAELCSRHVI